MNLIIWSTRGLLRYIGLVVWTGLVASCGTAIHTTEVKPGMHLDVVLGQLRTEQDERKLIAALEFGYGWKYENTIIRGFQLKVNAPYLSPAISVDLYSQLFRAPIDFGAGVLIGVMPGAYVQTGKGFYFGNTRLGVDLGFRGFVWDAWSNMNQKANTAEQIYLLPFGPYVLLSLQNDIFRIGLWSEYSYEKSGRSTGLCYTNCGVEPRKGPRNFGAGGLQLGLTF